MQNEASTACQVGDAEDLSEEHLILLSSCCSHLAGLLRTVLKDVLRALVGG